MENEKIDLSKFVIKQTEEEQKPIVLTDKGVEQDDSITLRVPSETKEKLRELGSKYGLSLSETIRQLVDGSLQVVERDSKK